MLASNFNAFGGELDLADEDAGHVSEAGGNGADRDTVGPTIARENRA
jgi:hypothetical protein